MDLRPGGRSPGGLNDRFGIYHRAACPEETGMGSLLFTLADGGLGAGGAVIGLGLAVMGAGWGIGRIGGQAVEGIARQPEASGKIVPNMIIAAALIEGVAFTAIILGFIMGK